MEVRSEGPLRAGSLVFLSAGGAWTFTVVAKATFLLAPGESPLVLTGGDPVTAADVCFGEDPRQSLRLASDLVPFKRGPEVLVTGSAYTPAGRIMGSLTARVAVAEVDKVVEVHGERYFDLEGRLSEPAPWTRMPLRWERAAGGPGTTNPVGVPTGPDARPDQWGRIVLPNLWPVWASPSGPRDPLATIGFGPLSADWPERLTRLHRHAPPWDARALRARQIPGDFDPAYYNAAPADQRLARLDGDERLVLENLHPEHAQLTTRLARIDPRATLDVAGGPPIDVPLTLDTLWIDSDRGVATLTYRGHLYIDEPAHPGTVVVRLPGAPLASALVPAPEATHAHAPPPAHAHAHEADDGEVEDIELLTDVGLEEEDSGVEDVESTVTVTGDPAGLGALLPFWPAAAGSAPPAPAAPVFAAPPAPAAPVFAEAPVPAAEAFPAAAASAPDPYSAAIVPVAVPLAAAPAALPGGADWTLATLGERLVGGTTTLAQVLHAQAVISSPPPSTPPPPPAPEPPALVLEPPPPGSLAAGPGGEGAFPPDTPPPPAEPPPPGALDDTSTAAPEPPAPAPPAEPPPLPLSAYPLERCAAVTASLDRRPDERKAILDDESLDDATWERLSAHWKAAVDRELARHRNGLLRAQDAAYVARLEEERGPLAAADYARLAVAAEVSDPAPVLRELDLPDAAWPRIRRVWIARMAKDPKLAAIVRSLIDQQP